MTGEISLYTPVPTAAKFFLASPFINGIVDIVCGHEEELPQPTTGRSAGLASVIYRRRFVPYGDTLGCSQSHGVNVTCLGPERRTRYPGWPVHDCF